MNSIFLNPFSKYSDKVLFWIAVILTISGGFAAYLFNARFDGALDLHFPESVSARQPVIDLSIDIISSTAVFFAAAKLINSKTRLFDIFTTVTIARFPLYLLTFFNYGNIISDSTAKMAADLEAGKMVHPETGSLLLLFAFGMSVLIFLVWFFALLWNGYKVATNARGAKSVIYFIFAAILAEAVSKIIFMNLN